MRRLIAGIPGIVDAVFAGFDVADVLGPVGAGQASGANLTAARQLRKKDEMMLYLYPAISECCGGKWQFRSAVSDYER
jgi:hypothetical protein